MAGAASVGADWADALKKATWRPNVGAARGEPGIPGVIPDPNVSPIPGVESIYPHTVLRGSPSQTLTITGFNFVQKSVVYVGETPVPTQVVSRTQIKATIDQNILARAGNHPITVRNPLPVDAPQWGDRSNVAHLLVPFEFTTKYSMNKDVKTE